VLCTSELGIVTAGFISMTFAVRSRVLMLVPVPAMLYMLKTSAAPASVRTRA